MDVRSVENLLGTPVSYDSGVEAGPWLFLSSHEAYDWRTVTGKSHFKDRAGADWKTRGPPMSKSETATCRMLAARKARYSGRDAPPAVIL